VSPSAGYIYITNWLMAQANLPIGPRSNNLERLNDAGFIRITSSKSVSERSGSDSPEKEGSKEPKRESAASSARRNGAASRHRKELALAVSTASSWLEDDAPHLVHQTVRETWPLLADEVIAGLTPKPAQNGTPHTSPDHAADEINLDDIPF
jgi:hypothetical protein